MALVNLAILEDRIVEAKSEAERAEREAAYWTEVSRQWQRKSRLRRALLRIALGFKMARIELRTPVKDI